MKAEPKQKEVWLVDLGEYKPGSSVQRGKKPCVILSNVNESEIDEVPCRVVTVGPLTTKIKKLNMPTHTLIRQDEGLREDSCFLGEQTTTVFVQECVRKLSEVNEVTFKRVVRCAMRSQLTEDELNELLREMGE